MLVVIAAALVVGVGGMPLWNLAVLEVLCVGAFVVSTWPFDDALRGQDRRTAFERGTYVTFRLTRHEVVAQSVLGVCGLVSYFLLPGGHLDIPWGTLLGYLPHITWGGIVAHLPNFNLHWWEGPTKIIAPGPMSQAGVWG